MRQTRSVGNQKFGLQHWQFLSCLFTRKTQGVFSRRRSDLDLFLAPCLMSVIWMSAARLPLGSLTTI